jgi:RNA polymerase sigma-70 factor, ECF subfamily
MIRSLSLPMKDAFLETHELDELIRRSRSGDAAAFDQLVDLYYPTVHRIAYRMLGDSEAEDAVQEIFIRTWRSIGRFRGASQFATWLHTIAVNQCHDIGRRQNRRRNHLSFADDAAEVASTLSKDRSGDPSMSTDDWVLRIAVRDAISRLPETLRIAVTLRFYGDFPVEEIATILGVPRTTVYSRLNLAMRRLERVLSATEEG